MELAPAPVLMTPLDTGVGGIDGGRVAFILTVTTGLA